MEGEKELDTLTVWDRIGEDFPQRRLSFLSDKLTAYNRSTRYFQFQFNLPHGTNIVENCPTAINSN